MALRKNKIQKYTDMANQEEIRYIDEQIKVKRKYFTNVSSFHTCILYENICRFIFIFVLFPLRPVLGCLDGSLHWPIQFTLTCTCFNLPWWMTFNAFHIFSFVYDTNIILYIFYSSGKTNKALCLWRVWTYYNRTRRTLHALENFPSKKSCFTEILWQKTI
jgi:hypothetical protein